MIRIDLITGFLGSGKTTFIQKYAAYLLRQGKKAGIVENDYGAVNVDTMLLQELERDGCIIESVASSKALRARATRIVTADALKQS